MLTQEMLQELYDKEAIRVKLTTYTRGVDRIDATLAKSVFTEDAVLDYAFYEKTTRDFVIDSILDQHRNMYNTAHLLTNIMYKFDGDTATTETYAFCNCYSGTKDNLFPCMNLVRYLDKWVKKDGEWFITDRQLSTDMSIGFPATCTVDKIRSERDGNGDPSYQYV